jgi:hypothetical protein
VGVFLLFKDKLMPLFSAPLSFIKETIVPKVKTMALAALDFVKGVG